MKIETDKISIGVMPFVEQSTNKQSIHKEFFGSSITHRWRNRGGGGGAGPPTFFFQGDPGLPTLFFQGGPGGP